MSARPLQLVLRHVNTARRGGLSDSELLAQFIARRDEAAFTALVRRHGGLVQGVCRSVLQHQQDAEDAAQATFLVLAKRASSIRNADSLSGWLHGAAYRIACKARTQAARRRRGERNAAASAKQQVIDDLSWREAQCVLHEELRRLPEKYRLPLIACCLEGRSRDEAARQLGWTFGTLKGMLDRGRDLLRKRLERRGITLAAALATMTLTQDTTAATCAATAQAALAFAAGMATNEVSLSAVALAQSMFKCGFQFKATALAGLLLAMGLTTGLAYRPAESPTQPPNVQADAKQQVERPTRTDLHGDPLPDGALLRFGTLRFRHPGPVNALAMSPDGKSLATTGSRGGLLWDAATGKPGPTLATGHNNYMAAQNLLAFSADSQRVFHIHDGGTGLVARNRTTGRVDFVMPIEGNPNFHSLNPSPDGKFVAIGTNLGVRLVEIASERVVWKTDMGAGFVRPKDDRLISSNPYSQGVFSPDGKMVAVHGGDAPKTLRLLDASNGEEQRRIELDGRLFQFAFSADSKRIAVTERENAVRVYETATGRRLHSWTLKLTNPYENYTCAVVFSPNGKTLAAAATDHLIHLWDLETGRELDPLRGHSWYVTGLAFDPKGHLLYSTGWDGSIRRWDTATWREKPISADTATGTVARSPAGPIIVWEGDGGVLHVGDAVSGKKFRTLAGNPAGFSDLTFSPDGSILAAGGNDLSVQLWDVAAGKMLRQWSWPKGEDPHTDVNRMTFTSDGKILATVSFRAKEVVLWDVKTGERRGQVRHNEVYGAAFSPDDSTLITAGWDRAVRWWHMPDLKLIDTVTLPKEVIKGPDGLGDARLHDLARSPDGRLLATIDLGGAFGIWDAKDRKLLRSFPGLRGQCNIAFSPDGQWLTAGNYSGAVGLWDVRSGQQVLKLAGHPAGVFSTAFGPDGRTLLTGSDDRTVLVWDLRPKIDVKAERNPKALWDALAGTDAVAAYQAVWLLADQPDRTIPFLKNNLTPAKPLDKTAKLRKLLDSLDSDVFSEREAASKELAACGEAIVPELQHELSGENSLEKSRRLQSLLDSLAPGVSAQEARQVRAITALTWANTAESRQLLEALAKGAPEARLTREAKAALERLERR
jgi:RNA polymerase sigma factor (sigma-70 family)